MNTTTALQTVPAPDRDGLVPGRPARDVRLGLVALLVAIVAAVTLASPAQGAPAGGVGTALVRGLHVLVSDPASASLHAPEAVVVADDR